MEKIRPQIYVTVRTCSHQTPNIAMEGNFFLKMNYETNQVIVCNRYIISES